MTVSGRQLEIVQGLALRIYAFRLGPIVGQDNMIEEIGGGEAGLGKTGIERDRFVELLVG